MTTNISILGLGQIGGSVGLALADHTALVHRTGHDLEYSVARQAEKAGAVDKITPNLIQAVQNADIILLSMPFDHVQNTLQAISQDLQDGAVLMDTCPGKRVIAGWVKELIPEGRYYLGLTPVLNPAYIASIEAGFTGAKADLFKNGQVGISAPPGTPGEALKLAADLCSLIGAKPLFTDMLEVDGQMAYLHVLPQILAASFVDFASSQPGWEDSQKVAGKFFAQYAATLLFESYPGELGSVVTNDKENFIRLINGYLTQLIDLREDLKEENIENINKRIDRSKEAFSQWWLNRKDADWGLDHRTLGVQEIPTSGEMLGRMIGFKKKPKQSK